MSTMREVFACLNWLSVPIAVAQTVQHSDWKAARKRGGMGIAGEALRGLAGANCYPFFVPSDGEWGAPEIQNLLARHGIAMWGAGWANGEMSFRVSERQAAWAQYVMLRAGVPLQRRLLAKQPASGGGSAAETAPRTGAAPPVTEADRVLDWVDALLG